MNATYPLIAIVLLAAIGFWMGRRRSVAAAPDGRLSGLHSLPSYYGAHVAIWAGLPAFVLLLLWIALRNTIIEGMVLDSLPAALQELPSNRLGLILSDIRNTATGAFGGTSNDPAIKEAAAYYNHLQSLGNVISLAAIVVVSLVGIVLAYRAIAPEFRARNSTERVLTVFMFICSTIAVLTTVGIVLSLLFEAIRFFQKVSIFEFLFGLTWSPQTAIREGQVGASGAFGAIPVFVGTFLVTIIAMIIAVPVGLFSAIYLSEFANKRVRATVKPLMEILAGVPTVVYGFFAALTVAPFVREFGTWLGLNVASESALAAGVVMGIMIIPFVSSLSDDVINAVPQSLRDGAYGLGATQAETIRNIIVPAALPGIAGAVLLAVSRAIGETMIVVMAAGLAANMTVNPFEAVTTVTVQIVTLLIGDQEFDSAKTLAAFALGLVLFVMTLILNVIALRIVQKYREKYD
jgi:phosphate transport system permease protein